jgi:tRNA-2-methylthio-N6-dimethylallyladenosine synthase
MEGIAEMGNTQKLVYIETLGCQMNKSDSERILGILSSIGYDETEEIREADLLIVNTCNIRQLSADKAYSRLGRWGQMKEHRDIKIAICGCVAQQDAGKVFARAPYVDLVFGTHNIYELPNLLKRTEIEQNVCSILKTPYQADESQFTPLRKEGFNAWIPIIEGCDYFCTYCVVPYVRGRQRSRKPEDIIKEAKDVVAQGYKEITLLGQTVDSYGRDFEDKAITLSSLLCELNDLEGLLRIRFVTSYPTDITDELIQTVKKLDKVCEYFHLPMQSGSTKVLERMKRRYTREEYIEICTKIRTQIPNVAITSDFIVGFPGETEEQFQESMSIIDELELDYSNTAAYSPRKQTPAATWKGDFVDAKTKKERIKIINAKVKEATQRSNEKYVGKVLEVLVDQVKEQDGVKIISGKSRNEKVVHAKGDESMIGTLVNVLIKEASIWCVKGEVV